MKNKRKFFVTGLYCFALTILLYLSGGITAMADGQAEMNVQRVAGEPEAEPVEEPEQPAPAGEPEAMPVEALKQPVEPEQAAEPKADVRTAIVTEINSEPAVESDSVSGAEEFMAWMETHTETGGSLKLTDDITLSGALVFIPEGPGCPHIFVDTDGHTITITGEVEFWNDYHLTFRCGTENDVVFRVAEGGILNLNHISIECVPGEPPSEAAAPYVLWQEEGAGLMVNDCHIAGEIHYADTPFVVYENKPSVIVEKGQQAVFPTEIICDVNFQGQISSRQPVPVSWDLEGKEQMQANRLRFQVSGSYSGAASVVPPICTVIYHDYPLTFTEVEAAASKQIYIFRCEYMKQEQLLPQTIMVEYSLDGENWFLYEEEKESDVKNGFCICLMDSQWNTAESPYLYLRLQCEYESVRYFSNVLQFTADNLKEAADQGGSRGGGTSVINPPKEPDQNSKDASLDGADQPVMKPENGENQVSSETESDENGSLSISESGENNPPSDPESAGDTMSSNAENVENNQPIKQEISADAVPSNVENGENSLPSDVENGENSLPSNVENGENSLPSNAENIGSTSFSTQETTGSNPSSGLKNDSNDGLDIRQPAAEESQAIKEVPNSVSGRNLAIVVGFAGLSAAAGATGFCVHAGLFRRLLQAAQKRFR